MLASRSRNSEYNFIYFLTYPALASIYPHHSSPSEYFSRFHPSFGKTKCLYSKVWFPWWHRMELCFIFLLVLTVKAFRKPQYCRTASRTGNGGNHWFCGSVRQSPRGWEKPARIKSKNKQKRKHKGPLWILKERKFWAGIRLVSNMLFNRWAQQLVSNSPKWNSHSVSWNPDPRAWEKPPGEAFFFFLPSVSLPILSLFRSKKRDISNQLEAAEMILASHLGL